MGLTGGSGITTLVCDYGGVLTNPLLETYQAFADRTGIPIAIVIGSQEHAEGMVTLQDLRKHEDNKTKVPRAEVVERLRALL